MPYHQLYIMPKRVVNSVLAACLFLAYACGLNTYINLCYQKGGADVSMPMLGFRVLPTCWSNRQSVYLFWNEAGLVSDNVI